MHSDLAVLKDQYRIPEIWLRLGLPGAPNVSCRVPWRDDKNPSFSIYDQGRRWKDFATGDAGDVIDFISHSCEVNRAEAIRRFRAMTVGFTCFTIPQSRPKKPLVLPTKAARRGTQREINEVAQSRRLDPDAVSLAQSLNTLTFGEVCGLSCWILSDEFRRVAEARRMDGKPFAQVGSLPRRKAHTLRGSSKSWPVGAAVLARLSRIRAVLLVEGGPDYLAALHFSIMFDKWDLLPVAMLGRESGSQIAPEALELLKGRRIRIYPHADRDGKGVVSAEKWAVQLHKHGCELDLYKFDGLVRSDGRPVKDLNDAACIRSEQKHELQDILP